MSVIGCFLKTTCTFGFFFFFFSPSGKVSLFVSVETAGMLASSPHVCVCVVVVRSVPYLFQLCNTKQKPFFYFFPFYFRFLLSYTRVCATHACRSTSNSISPPLGIHQPPFVSLFERFWWRFKFPCQPFVDYHHYSAARILTRYLFLFPPSSHSPSPHHTHSDSMLTPMDAGRQSDP